MEPCRVRSTTLQSGRQGYMQAGGWAGREAYYTCYSHMYLLYTIFNFTLSNIEHLICHRLSGNTSTYWNVLFLFLAKLKKSRSYI